MVPRSGFKFRLPAKFRLANELRLPAKFRLAALVPVLAFAPFAGLALHTPGLAAQMQRDNKPSETGAMPPKTWIDKDTGHRVWRVSDEPNSGAFYFNVNEFTPDHKQMVYNSPDGIRVLDLATMTTRMLVPNQAAPPPPALPRMPRRAGRRVRAREAGAASDSAAERAPLLWDTRPTASSSRAWTR